VTELKEFSLELRLRNNRLRGRRLRAGLTAVELSQSSGVPITTISRLEGLRLSPLNKAGQWILPAQLLAAAFGVPESELFPDSVFEVVQSRAEIEMDGADVSGLLGDYQERVHSLATDPGAAHDRQELSMKIESLLRHLPARERRAIRARYNADPTTLAELGKKFGVGREAARQIEQKAIRRLRDMARAALPEFTRDA